VSAESHLHAHVRFDAGGAGGVMDSPQALTKAAWLFAALAFGAVIAVIAQRGEIAEVLGLLGHTRLIWLLTAIGLQALTYVTAAGVWHVALRRTPQPQSLYSLIWLALAMLFSNQAVPSAGISGGLVVVKALVRRRVPEPIAMSALLLGLVTTYLAFVVSFGVAAVWASSFDRLWPVVLVAGFVFFLMAASVTCLVFESHRVSVPWRQRLTGIPILGHAIGSIITASNESMRARELFEATWLQLAEILLDAATLGVSLRAVGWPVSGVVVFGSYVIAAVGSRVALAPLGIGTFEAGSVALLHAGGVPLEPALAGTLLFRGFTLWLPMLPGLVTTRRALDVGP
jgi:uncharacterized membrane protein YbhN (UPF0104 family)